MMGRWPISTTYGGSPARCQVLAVRVDGAEEKQQLLDADPARFFTEPHYNGYPAVLIRLSEVDVDELTELLTDAWWCMAPKDLRDTLER